jgi:hypothetical protein
VLLTKDIGCVGGIIGMFEHFSLGGEGGFGQVIGELYFGDGELAQHFQTTDIFFGGFGLFILVVVDG